MSPDVTLEVLDWGGSGEPLILLAGLGNTAHVFDDFAPLLSDRFRVVGVTRRGFGASTRTNAGLRIDTLLADVVAVMDALGIDGAVLAGHSFGGDEITALALAHPERVRALVYLDAAHDRTGLPSLSASAPYPEAPEWAPDEDPHTVEGWERYLTRFRGVRFPRNEVEALLEPDSTGRLAPRPEEVEAMTEVLTDVRQPAFDDLAAPVLALFAIPETPTELFPYIDDGSPQEDRRRAHRAWEVYRWWEREQVRRFERMVPDGRVVVVPRAHHFLFLSHPNEVAHAMLGFLAETPEGGFH